MNIFEHFGCYTKIPVRLHDVAQHAVDNSDISRFLFHKVRADESILRGMSRVSMLIGAYGERIADITYSHQITDEAMVKLVCCKEILHAIEDNSLSASSEDAVSNLIDRISAPIELHPYFNSDTSDKVGLFAALAILMPMGFLDDARPHVEVGALEVEAIAEQAQVPVTYVRWSLHPRWPEIVDEVTKWSVSLG